MRKPAEFRLLSCLSSDGQEFLLTFSKERGFFEPITNVGAASIGIEIVGWRYEQE